MCVCACCLFVVAVVVVIVLLGGDFKMKTESFGIFDLFSLLLSNAFRFQLFWMMGMRCNRMHNFIRSMKIAVYAYCVRVRGNKMRTKCSNEILRSFKIDEWERNERHKQLFDGILKIDIGSPFSFHISLLLLFFLEFQSTWSQTV